MPRPCDARDRARPSCGRGTRRRLRRGTVRGPSPDHRSRDPIGQLFHVTFTPMRHLPWVAWLAVACSGPSRAPTDIGDGRGTRTVTYAPLGMKADAKVRTQAVILGTDAKGGSTVIPLVDGEGRTKLDTMVVKIGGGAVSGE